MIMNFSCNDLFVKLLEIKEINLFNENEGYDGFRNLVTSNWIEFYLEFINFLVDRTSCKIKLANDLLFINKNKVNAVVRDIELVKRMYMEEANLICEIYFKINLVNKKEAFGTEL